MLCDGGEYEWAIIALVDWCRSVKWLYGGVFSGLAGRCNIRDSETESDGRRCARDCDAGVG